MFDPTIFDNIKVVLEGIIYDLDLDNRIKVLNRKDIIDLARMDRTYIIEYKMAEQIKEQRVKIHLNASTNDLASEILEQGNNTVIGCEINIYFYSIVLEESQSNQIREMLSRIWDNRLIEQRISYLYNESINKPDNYLNESAIIFDRKIGESNISDLNDLIKHTLFSLEELNVII